VIRLLKSRNSHKFNADGFLAVTIIPNDILKAYPRFDERRSSGPANNLLSRAPIRDFSRLIQVFTRLRLLAGGCIRLYKERIGAAEEQSG
jgi:hypothetical protein